MKDVAPDDLGMDPGPFMRTESYRALFKPRHTQLCGYVHRNSRMRTFLHTCGSIYDLIPDLIEAGYDVINPVQTNCGRVLRNEWRRLSSLRRAMKTSQELRLILGTTLNSG